MSVGPSGYTLQQEEEMSKHHFYIESGLREAHKRNSLLDYEVVPCNCDDKCCPR